MLNYLVFLFYLIESRFNKEKTVVNDDYVIFKVYNILKNLLTLRVRTRYEFIRN